MTIIVLEGADGQGKSHNIKRLHQHFGWEMFTCGKPNSLMDMDELYYEFDAMIDQPQIFLTDRAPFISDFVYSQAFHKPLLATVERHLKYWDQFEDLIYCRNENPTAKDVSQEYKAHKPKEFTEQVMQRHKRIQGLYDDLFNREDLPFTMTRFNGYDEAQYEKLCAYLDEKYC